MSHVTGKSQADRTYRTATRTAGCGWLRLPKMFRSDQLVDPVATGIKTTSRLGGHTKDIQQFEGVEKEICWTAFTPSADDWQCVSDVRDILAVTGSHLTRLLASLSCLYLYIRRKSLISFPPWHL